MGAGNAMAALRVAPDKLSRRARLTLIIMALISLDRDYGRHRARFYFAGHDAIVEHLGLFPSASRLRQVREDIRELVDAGLIEPIGYVERHRVYLLRLGEAVHNPGDNGPSP